MPEPRSQPGLLATNIPVPIASPPQPEKVARVRASSMTSPSPIKLTRKRTSSGVFQVDDNEPQPKKAEHARTLSDGALKKTKAMNGRRKTTETSENIQNKERKEKIIERFDAEAKTTCVTAFKESESWD